MSRAKDIVVGVLALAVLGLAVVNWRERQEIQRLLRAAGESVPAGGIASVTRRTVDERKLALRPTTGGGSLPDQAEASDRARERGGLRDVRDPAAAARTSALVRLLDNPEFIRALELHRQAGLDARFAGLFRQLALAPEELTAFKRLLVEKENVALDVVAVSESSPEGPLPAELLNASVAGARAKVEEAIRASLGSDRYSVYRDYEQTQPQRAVVTQLEQRLSYSAAPLAPAQAETLVRILAVHAPVFTAETAPPVVVSTGAGSAATVPLLAAAAPSARVTEAVLVQAQPVLAPTQLAALREIQIEQDASFLTRQLLGNSFPANDSKLSSVQPWLLQ